MIRGLLVKTLRETWVSVALFAVALATVERLLMYVLPQTQQMAGNALASMPLVRNLISAMIGVQVDTDLSAQLLQSILWVHPVVLALTWGFAIMACTRFPAGEIDRGTIDVLLGLPVSRRRAYVAESLISAASGAAIVACGAIGYWLGAAALPPADRPSPGRAMLVQGNFFCVFLAVCGATFLISSLCDRRGRAIAIVFALLLASFLLNFLAQFWPPAQRVAFLSVLHYYKPAHVMTTGMLPLRDVAVTLGVGAAAWLAGGEIIARRSICTT